MKVRKAIIPAAGLGTRFLPATKAQPKEMLPIVDKPTIQYIVEEAVKSGIEDIIIISGRGKRAIEDHFDKSYELEETLYQKEKYSILEEIQAITNLANIHYIRQKEPKGLGHAVQCASRFIGNEPFAVLLGDDIMHSGDQDQPALKQLMDIYDRSMLPVIGVQSVPQEDVSKYGIIDPKSASSELDEAIEVNGLVEKPKAEEAPSNLAIMGRYILTPNIFTILENQKAGSGGEIQLTDAINELNHHQQVLAYELKGSRYDVGDKLGFIKAQIDFALERTDLHDDLYEYLIEVLKRNQKAEKVT
ncbi:UTP--glucose-1-phosphate uridylyltransferase GalU [Bacillus sp. UMB0893]|uniref:UTP--glucose-1-phosphate uridylyltransferase GalU n=1 Tax=Bacillus sp. UMB0893 TaxID=2066053 RepID=UPI000C758389|nr:UTP--glucose-1-phosphate uridylyltransferase GalU [Bacillus sp. UMB0893]PLR67951.1 UTP--glucose-1-phosphate uridylyltransferase [Bacillus sp. UMB0893]